MTKYHPLWSNRWRYVIFWSKYVMRVNFLFQVFLDRYPWHALVWDGFYCVAASLFKCPHFYLDFANMFVPCNYFKVNWS